MKRPVGITIVSVLAIIGGGIQLLASLGYLGFTALRTPLILGVVSGMSPAMLLGTGVLSLIIGVLAIAFGIGALSLKSWSWLTGLIVWGVSLVFSVVQLSVTGHLGSAGARGALRRGDSRVPVERDRFVRPSGSRWAATPRRTTRRPS